MFRRAQSSRTAASNTTRRARLWLEQLEERCVPSGTDLGVAGQFNAFIFGDFKGTYSDVQGRLAVGHDATLTGYGIGDRLSNSHGKRDDLIVGDDLKFTNGQVFNGNIVYGHTQTLVGVGIPNGTSRKGNVLNFVAVESDLDAKSAKWANYGSNGTVQNNWGGLVLTGTDPQLNVFNLNASQLQNIWGLRINAPAGSTVLVNVSGTNATLQNFGMNLSGTDASRVLFNFNQAQKVTLSGIGFQGSILAPHAAVCFNNGSLTGDVVAQSFTGNGQLDLTYLHINIPEVRPATLSGKVFNDKNGDEIQQPDEAGIGNVTLILQGENISFYLTTQTNPDGTFTFTNLPPGQYTVAVVPPDGYTVSSVHVGSQGGIKDLPDGQTTGIVLGNGTNAIHYDFGLKLPGDGGGIEQS
jgi:choice-of-anchor A domain-containing protein